jgi:hypothetical protein
VLISYGPNQNSNYLTDADAGCSSNYCSNGDDIIIPINVQGEAIQIAKNELNVLAGRGCPSDPNVNGIIQQAFLDNSGLGNTYGIDPWSNNATYNYKWVTTGTTTGYWESDGPPGANNPLRSQNITCGSTIAGTVFNFATMNSDQIENFVANQGIYPAGDDAKWGADGAAEKYEENVNDNAVLTNTDRSGGDGQKLFLPIPEDTCNEYVIRAVARTTAPLSGGGHGYGIYFDTVLDESENTENPGFRFMFDRGFGGNPALQLRRVPDDDPDRWHVAKTPPDVPEKLNSWWTDLHYIRLTVTNDGTGTDRKVQASVFDLEPADYYEETDYLTEFSDFYFGPWKHHITFEKTYEHESLTETLHTGLRTWGVPSYFHYLAVENTCLPAPEDQADGIVLCVGDEPTQYLPYNSSIDGSDACDENEILVITSSVGSKTEAAFAYESPGGIYVESGVTLNSTDTQGYVKLVSSGGDIVIEEGADFNTSSNANNETEEIYIDAAGDVDIRGVTLTAKRYIYIKAGGNIYAINSKLTTTTNSKQTGIKLTGSNKIYVDDLCIQYGNNGVYSATGIIEGTRNTTSPCK